VSRDFFCICSFCLDFSWLYPPFFSFQLLNAPLSRILRGNLLKWDIITGSGGLKRERGWKPCLPSEHYKNDTSRVSGSLKHLWNNLTSGKIILRKEVYKAFNLFLKAILNYILRNICWLKLSSVEWFIYANLVESFLTSYKFSRIVYIILFGIRQLRLVFVLATSVYVSKYEGVSKSFRNEL